MDEITSVQSVGACVWPAEFLSQLFFLLLENAVDSFFEAAGFPLVLDLKAHHRRQQGGWRPIQESRFLEVLLL